MEDKLTTCRHCQGDACYEYQAENGTIWECMSCGFSTTTLHTEDSEPVNHIIESAPELYKALMFKDDQGLIWYPRTVISKEKGMVYLDGTSVENVQWTVVRAVPITKDEQLQTGTMLDFKMDKSTRKEFGKDFMNAFFYWMTGNLE